MKEIVAHLLEFTKFCDVVVVHIGPPRVRTHNQNMTVAARAQAERNRMGHLS